MVVLLPFDGSQPAHEAVQYAIKEHAGKELVLLRVVEVAGGSTSAGINIAQEKLKKLRKEAQSDIPDDVLDQLDEAGIEFEVEIVFGDPAREIVEYAETAENDVELILIGSHGRSGVSRVLLGSVAETVVRRSPVPVTVVR